MNQSPLLKSAAFAIPFVLIWTSAFPAAKIGLIDSPPLLFLAFRFLLAGVLMLAWATWRGTLRSLSLQELAILCALGLLNHALYLGLSWTGMGSLSSGFSTILISANPIVVGVLSTFLLREPLTRQKMGGLILGFLGVAFIVRHRIGSSTDSLEGFFLVSAALLTLAFGTVLYKKWPVKTDIVTGTGFQIILSGLILLPVAFWFEDFSAVNITPSFVASFLWLVGVVSITGYQLWFNLLESGSASAASVWFFLTPPLGLIAGAVLLDEPLNYIDFVGIVPVVLGIVMVTRAR